MPQASVWAAVDTVCVEDEQHSLQPATLGRATPGSVFWDHTVSDMKHSTGLYVCSIFDICAAAQPPQPFALFMPLSGAAYVSLIIGA